MMIFWLKILLILFLTIPTYAITPTDLNNGATATGMVQNLVGTNQVPVSNVQYTGDNSAAGTFTGGIADGFEFDAGVILSTGKIANAIGPNNRGGTGFGFNSSGDAELDAIAGRKDTFDAAVLEFSFDATGSVLSFEYIFASEEYNEYVGFAFNDVFGFFLDGQNVATVGCSNATNAVSINSINKNRNTKLFNNNDFADFNNVSPFGTGFDGFTVTLAAQAIITPGSHILKLAIEDVQDSDYDSAVLIKAGSFTTNPQTTQIEILNGGTPIVDGSTTAIDFGTVTVGTSTQKTFTIKNLSLVTLSLSNLSLPTGFSLIGTLPATIDGCGSANLVIQLDATTIGTFNGTLSMNTNDPAKNPFDFSISGTVNPVPVPNTAPPPTTSRISDIPTLSEWAIIFLSSLLLMFGLFKLRHSEKV